MPTSEVLIAGGFNGSSRAATTDRFQPFSAVFLMANLSTGRICSLPARDTRRHAWASTCYFAGGFNVRRWTLSSALITSAESRLHNLRIHELGTHRAHRDPAVGRDHDPGGRPDHVCRRLRRPTARPAPLPNGRSGRLRQSFTPLNLSALDKGPGGWRR